MSDQNASPPADGFAAAGPDVIAPGEGELIVNLEGFEGPLDLLLTLARDQKVDLRRISMVALVDQYLAHLPEVAPAAARAGGGRGAIGPGDGRRLGVAAAPPRGDAGSRRAPDGPPTARQGR